MPPRPIPAIGQHWHCQFAELGETFCLRVLDIEGDQADCRLFALAPPKYAVRMQVRFRLFAAFEFVGYFSQPGSRVVLN